MQAQICPRCKFRITSARAICNTCGYSLQSGRKAVDTPAITQPVKRSQTSTNASRPQPAAVRPAVVNPAPKAASAGPPSARTSKSAATPSGGAGSFWRLFFGLDPLPREKPERDDRALDGT